MSITILATKRALCEIKDVTSCVKDRELSDNIKYTTLPLKMWSFNDVHPFLKLQDQEV